MQAFRPTVLAAVLAAVMGGAPAFAESVDKLERVQVDLVAPPMVHKHEQKAPAKPRVVEFKLVIEEKKVVIDAEGTTMQAMTFNGSMPGPTLVVHEGDYVEVTLVNPKSNMMPHNVDFHSATGALTGDGALKAKVGETVLIIHSQANRDTRPHLIGGHGDWVWDHGKFNNPPLRDLETWFIPGGTAGAALYTFKQPGVYAYVNHNLIEAFELGAAGHFVVEGEWDHDLMTQVKAPHPIPEGK